MSPQRQWFTEDCDECGTAFRVAVRRLLHEERSPFQHIQVYETETLGNLLVLDGFIMLSSRDNFFYHEMMTHPALYTHPAPRRVLIVGGGDCGCLQECLKHPGLEQVDQVDIDERVTRVSERFFPELCTANDDPRARLHFADAIEWVARAAPGQYDVIVIDSTDPIGQAARLFSADFYRDCHRALGDHGVLVAQSESPLFHRELMEAMATRMQAAGFDHTARLYFPQCVYPSGWWTATLASRAVAPADFRVLDAQAKPFPTRYYNAAIHQGALAEPEFLRAAIPA